MSSEQQKFLDAVARICSQSVINGEVICLTGEAGSGKTATVAQLAKQFKVRFLTFTHEAKSVLLSRLLEEDVDGFSMQTIHSYLRMIPNHNVLPPEDDVWKMEFMPGRGIEPLPSKTIIVVDETSLVKYEHCRAISDSNPEGITIFSGDDKQLKPVGGKTVYEELMAAAKEGTIAHFHLTQNFRSQHPELTAYINRVREAGQFPLDAPKEYVTFYDDPHEILDVATAAIEEYGQENVLLVAHENRTVNAYASRIRERLGFAGEYPNVGEILRVGSPCQVYDWNNVYRWLLNSGVSNDKAFNAAKACVRDNVLNNGDRLKVTAVLPIETISTPWATQKVEVSPIQVDVLSGYLKGQSFLIRTPPLGDCGLKTSPIDTMLSQCRSVAATLVSLLERTNINWGAQDRYVQEARQFLIKRHSRGYDRSDIHGGIFYNAFHKFADVTSATAMTVHKAQGSGRDHVIVVDDFGAKADSDSLRYTAISRARERVSIFRSCSKKKSPAALATRA